MGTTEMHLFHIPVLGIGYSIDTPIKVARYGISSAISIMDDELLEKMTDYHCQRTGRTFSPIAKQVEDYRAKRITAYLDLVYDIVNDQVEELKGLPFEKGNELCKYFELLPTQSHTKRKYMDMMAQEEGENKEAIKHQLLNLIKAGAIDVNIMSKVDKLNKDSKKKTLPEKYSDALSALRGFANSKLKSSVIFSAGYNPRLYNYIEDFADFFPDNNSDLCKRVILKVSDYRSALIQGKVLAKKGIWVSEFRIESGLNCGGHAFATAGLLLGPILEEFKANRSALYEEMYSLCITAHTQKGISTFRDKPVMKITVQGGVGTAEENNFLRDYYGADSIGWGSPFLLVPEATNVDEYTLQQLATAQKEDYYLSNASPLGIPFNNFKKSTAEQQRKERISKSRPGSPCYKKHLVSNTEFTDEPICTASRQYQRLKINQLRGQGLTKNVLEAEIEKVTEKDCLCEGLGAPVLLKDGIPLSHKLSAVSICPGPNLAYFSGIWTLSEMTSHIYGKMNLLNSTPRSHMFINELNLYIDYLKNECRKAVGIRNNDKYLQRFKDNLKRGISYYENLLPHLKRSFNITWNTIHFDLKKAYIKLHNIPIY